MQIRTLAFALAPLAFAFACAESEPPEPPLLPIPVARVLQRDQTIWLEMVGQTRGSADIPIRTRVEGVVLGMHFAEGGRVEQGDLLYTIEPDTYEAKVLEAKGHLAEANTQLVKARADLDRIRPLAEMRAVSQVDLDGAVAQYDAAGGSVQVARARVDQANIELGFTLIHSPIAGRIGITKATVGEFVGRPPNPVVLNFVSLTDPIRVRFSIDERSYLRLARRLRELERNEIAENQRGLELILADGSVHEHLGQVIAADAAIDPQTGTFTLEADFPNPEQLVLAGQFARVRAVVEVRKDALLVPQRAISELQGIFRVFVVDEDGIVGLRVVELGPKIDRLQIVEKGLASGDRVALAVARLRPDMKVAPKLVRLSEDGSVLEDPAPAGAETAAKDGREA